LAPLQVTPFPRNLPASHFPAITGVGGGGSDHRFHLLADFSEVVVPDAVWPEVHRLRRTALDHPAVKMRRRRGKGMGAKE
jgi:hypothetical protein